MSLFDMRTLEGQIEYLRALVAITFDDDKINDLEKVIISYNNESGLLCQNYRIGEYNFLLEEGLIRMVKYINHTDIYLTEGGVMYFELEKL